MHISGIIFSVAVVAALAYLAQTNGRISWRRSIAKTAPVALFAVAACFHSVPALLVAALLASAIGDFALSRPGSKWFLTGMVAFALAHLGYIAVMLAGGADLQVSQWPLILVMLAIGASTEIWLRPHTADLKWPVRGYVVIILAMGLVALGLPDVMWLALIGAVLFVMSDLILSVETFVLDQDHKMRKLAGKTVWISYICAQIALLLGLGGVSILPL